MNSSKNFKYLDELINGSTTEIVLDSDITMADGEESEYFNGIRLDVNDLLIDGMGHAIDACGKARIFLCTGKNIAIKNITLKNGRAEDGGAIQNDGELTISKSCIGNNIAHYGGAIRNDGKLDIIESRFKRNVSKRDGGAIHNNGDLTLVGLIFNENISHRDGGTIRNDAKLVMSKSAFENNRAQGIGGAIRNNSKLTIANSSFIGNTSKYDGGAIYNNRGTLTIRGSLFNENSSDGDGGAIYHEDGSLKVFGCEFTNNVSPRDIIHNKDYMVLQNSNFKDNHAKNIIVNLGDLSTLSIFDGEFAGNAAGESIVVNDGKYCSIEKGIFKNNASSKNIVNRSSLTLICPKIPGKGNSILNDGKILIKSMSSKLLDRICGGGEVNVEENIVDEWKFDFGYLDWKIHESGANEIILGNDICFEDYEIDFYEDGIELDMDNLLIDGNGHEIDATDRSRIFIVTGSDITLKNITFKNGHSHRNYDNPLNNNGGAIKINHNSRLTLDNCRFINNNSEEFGGAIFNFGELIIIESAFDNNVAHSMGGAIYNCNAKASVEKSFLNKNSAYGMGGAIYNNGEMTVRKSSIDENLSQYGGAIINDGELEISQSALIKNKSNLAGGAIKNNNLLALEESSVDKNVSQYGGGIYNGGELKIDKSSLNDNVSYVMGGAIHNNDATLTITESQLNRNTANDGGAIFLGKSAKHKLDNCTFSDNKPDDVKI